MSVNKNNSIDSAKVVEALKTKGYTVEAKELNKNGVAKIGYVFLDGENNAKPTLYIGEDAPTEPEEIADYLINIYKNADSFSFDVNSITDWNRVKDNLVLGVCGTGKEQIPCKTILDLDVFARIILNDSVIGNGSIKVTEDILKTWNKSLDEVLEVAAENIKHNAVAQDIRTLIFGILGNEAEALDLDNLDAPMIVITNNSQLFGAGQMFNTEVLEKVANQLDSDLYILPSSIHEIIVVAESLGPVEPLAEMVKDVNATQVAPEDVLTNSVYKFDRKEKRLTLAK